MNLHYSSDDKTSKPVNKNSRFTDSMFQTVTINRDEIENSGYDVKSLMLLIILIEFRRRTFKCRIRLILRIWKIELT